MSLNTITPTVATDSSAPVLHVLENGARISPPCTDRNEALRIAATAIMYQYLPRLQNAVKGVSKRKAGHIHAMIETLEGSCPRTDGRNVFLSYKQIGMALRVWNAETGREKPVRFSNVDIDGWRVV
jgi:hypothetical protein